MRGVNHSVYLATASRRANYRPRGASPDDTTPNTHGARWSTEALGLGLLFADEVDSFLGQRKSSEHETVTNMKTEFMSLWDGFLTNDQARVMVRAHAHPKGNHARCSSWTNSISCLYPTHALCFARRC